MAVGAIIQARMSSRRLPGKVLHNVAGKPMLQYLLERLEHCRSLAAIVVATSREDSDTPIADFCLERGVPHYRGPLCDVAGRFKEVLGIYHFDGFVRVCGDSPLLDQRLIDQGVEIFLKGSFDVVTNVFPRSYPVGQSVEVLRSDTFIRDYPLMQEDDDLEHVTKFFYRNHEDYTILNFASEKNCSGIRLCVNTEQDMNTFTAIIAGMHKSHWQYGLQELLPLYQEVVQ